MVDAKHADCGVLLVDLVHDAVGATTRRVQIGELSPQLPTEALWVLEEWSEHELDDGRRHFFVETIELSGRRSRDAELVASAATSGHRD
jgi:hypothetical protein